MARARNIKPGFFKNEDLAALPHVVRLLFIGLWSLADRDGRLENRPQRIRAEVFPYEVVDIPDGISRLESLGFLKCYSIAGKNYIEIVNWRKHQHPHHQENESVIPSSDKAEITSEVAPKSPRSNPSDFLIPDTGFSDSPIAADADVVTDEMVDLIRKAHPRGTEDADDGRKAILKAIKKESKVHGSRKDAARFLYKRALFYRHKVSEWPPGEEKFGKMCATWFNKGAYDNPDSSYERKSNGTANDTRNSKNVANILSGLGATPRGDGGIPPGGSLTNGGTGVEAGPRLLLREGDS
jgi:hypothetical protein